MVKICNNKISVNKRNNKFEDLKSEYRQKSTDKLLNITHYMHRIAATYLWKL